MSLPPEPPLRGRIIVATLAILLGAYVTYETSKDFEFVKFVPHSPEEVERRKREHIGMSIKHLETRTLDYKPEVKERIKKMMEEKEKEKEKENENKNKNKKNSSGMSNKPSNDV